MSRFDLASVALSAFSAIDCRIHCQPLQSYIACEGSLSNTAFAWPRFDSLALYNYVFTYQESSSKLPKSLVTNYYWPCSQTFNCLYAIDVCENKYSYSVWQKVFVI